ncbi:hypothetical protein O3G_MSEX002884 [Manduca sexta]|uniref:t-SNARE coiled-coil homology domain-containing protein n=1 Tax=Manduca sexta TaxID=7130 RepID=A0A921YPW4_MANSE|nr:hypothetical protein O3G_MSEX002884 [Manduca sexta]
MYICRDYGATAAVPAVSFADFSPTELYNLSEGIAENVNTINSGLRSLEKMMKQIGGPGDNRLGVVVRRGDKPQKLQVERLTQAFRDALAKYTEVQKQVSEKMAAHMPRPPRMRNTDPQLLEQQAIADDEESTALAQQLAQARLVEFETSMLVEREEYMNKIEADVMDVNHIIQELSEMVHQQSQAVETVQSQVEAASANVEAGVDELAKAEEHQRRYRKKMLILSIIGAILAILLIVWIVKAFK